VGDWRMFLVVTPPRHLIGWRVPQALGVSLPAPSHMCDDLPLLLLHIWEMMCGFFFPSLLLLFFLNHAFPPKGCADVCRFRNGGAPLPPPLSWSLFVSVSSACPIVCFFYRTGPVSGFLSRQVANPSRWDIPPALVLHVMV